MALTKDDIQTIRSAIREEIRPIVQEEVQGALIGQNKIITQHFADLKDVIQHTYVNREEFEERYNELQNEVDDLRKEVQALKQKIHTP